MKVFSNLLVLLLVWVSFTADQFVLEKSITVKADFITTDNLGNCYVVRYNIIEKYDGKGNLLRSYSNKSYGAISFLDATNPLKLLVFYNGFQQLLFLDGMLAEQGEPVSVSKLGYPLTSLVCSSYNNGFWIYNVQNMELIRFNEDFQITHQTGNIAQLTGSSVSPNQLIEHDNKLYLNDRQKGIFVFDVFGTYSKNIPITGFNKLQVRGEDIFIVKNKNEILKFNTKLLEETTILLPDSALDARIEKNKLFLHHKNGFNIYTIK